MPIDIERLRRIIELESKKGYDNTAVIGGLDKFLVKWAKDNLPELTSPPRLRRLREIYPTSFSYAALSPSERKKWAAALLAFLTEPAAAPKMVRDPQVSRKPAAAKPKPKISQAGTVLDAPVSAVKGISGMLTARFARLGVRTVHDLLYFFPNRHLDYSHLRTISQLAEGAEQTITANVWEIRVIMPGGRRSTEATLGDATGNMRAVWFSNPWVAKNLKTGDQIVLSGRVKIFQGRPVFESPEWELLEDRELIHTGRLVPLYPLTSGLHQRQVRRLVKQAVDEYAALLPEFLPAATVKRRGFPPIGQAVSEYHFPDSFDLKEKARRRLAFDELFLLQLGVLSRKRRWQSEQPGVPIKIDRALLDRLIALLPFKLTAAQVRVLGEIVSDLERPVAMARLLQGEVGSGKTVIALIALLMAVAAGHQGALMAPTEVLADQHFKTIRRMLAGMGRETESGDNTYTFEGIVPKPIIVSLLMGDVKESAKAGAQKLISSGKVDIALGTHALIQKSVKFKKLGLAVVDEQHRFGVEQRKALRQKGFNPHLLAMTATPIPRTLALTLYGDLDLSVIGELPPGRQSIKTKWLKPEQRESAYAFVRKQVAEGRQAFIICPLIDESEVIQARSAVVEYEKLSGDIFPDLRLALLHGRMSAREKDEAMSGFNRRETDVLVSTPVIEVGIDIPNATVMMVESADRFGLSQLHQFRGRVGRGEAQSYCMLMADRPSDVALLRLDIIEHTQDGFKLADEDLKLRGPGEFFGTRQSGIPDLRMAKLSDVPTLEMAREEAERLFKEDPDLKAPEHHALVAEIARLWPEKKGDWS
jgi:ATP-dependent DNA helicase RecG